MRALENQRTHGTLEAGRTVVSTHTQGTIGTDKIPRVLRVFKNSTIPRAF